MEDAEVPVHAEEDATQGGEGRADRREGHGPRVVSGSTAGEAVREVGQALSDVLIRSLLGPSVAARVPEQPDPGTNRRFVTTARSSRSRSRPWLRLSSSASGKSPPGSRQLADGRRPLPVDRSGLATLPAARAGMRINGRRAAPRTRPRSSASSEGTTRSASSRGGAPTARRSTASRPGARPRPGGGVLDHDAAPRRQREPPRGLEEDRRVRLAEATCRPKRPCRGTGRAARAIRTRRRCSGGGPRRPGPFARQPKDRRRSNHERAPGSSSRPCARSRRR